MPYNYDLCFKTPQNRWIFVPTDECRTKGYEFIKFIQEKWTPPDFYFHLKPGGHIAALKIHEGNQFFSKTDIKSFFPSITKSKAIRALKDIGFNYSAADNIASWSTVKSKEDDRKWIVPYGFVQSQIISSLCLDKSAIGSFLKSRMQRGASMSVYVDDIILSGNDYDTLQADYSELINIFDKTGFKINQDKSHDTSEKTTVFNIDMRFRKTEIVESRFKDFSEAINPNNMRRSEAIISYTKSVSQKQSLALTEKLEQMKALSVNE